LSGSQIVARALQVACDVVNEAATVAVASVARPIAAGGAAVHVAPP
jgi:hypothetical protein